MSVEGPLASLGAVRPGRCPAAGTGGLSLAHWYNQPIRDANHHPWPDLSGQRTPKAAGFPVCTFVPARFFRITAPAGFFSHDRKSTVIVVARIPYVGPVQVGLRHINAGTVEWPRARCAGRRTAAAVRWRWSRSSARIGGTPGASRFFPPVSGRSGGLRRGSVLTFRRHGRLRFPGGSAECRRRPARSVPACVRRRGLAAPGGDDGLPPPAGLGAPAGWPAAVLDPRRGHGRLGGLCFASAGWTRAARDRAIGRAADARAENLPGPVRNHRFLLLPGVRVHGLASAAPPLAAGCVAEHWRERYRVRPVMACTCTGPGHDGCRVGPPAGGAATAAPRAAAGTDDRGAAAPRVAAPPRRKMARDPLPRTRTPAGAAGGAARRRKGRPGATGVLAPARPIPTVASATGLLPWDGNGGPVPARGCRPSFRTGRGKRPRTGCCRTKG